jgi:nitrilase
MPTNPERMVWGQGDGSGLKVVDTPIGRLGCLICWESYMPLARYALYAQGIDVYVAPTYDQGDGWVGTLQHIAREGCCWVVGCGCALQSSDFAEDFPERATLYPTDEWVNPGDSVVIAPGGKIEAGPLRREIGILYAEIDTDRVGLARRSLDVVGHYARPDLFRLQVDTHPRRPADLGQQSKPPAPITAHGTAIGAGPLRYYATIGFTSPCRGRTETTSEPFCDRRRRARPGSGPDPAPRA